MARKLALSHTIRKQTYRVRVRITSGEPSREEATYEDRGPPTPWRRSTALALTGSTSSAMTKRRTATRSAAYVRCQAGGPPHRFDGEFPTP